MDGFVGANVQILGARGLLERIEIGDFGVLLGFAAPDRFRVAVFGGFFESLVAPGSGDDVVDGVIGFAEVEGDGRELGGGAALEEENGVVGGDVE